MQRPHELERGTAAPNLTLQAAAAAALKCAMDAGAFTQPGDEHLREAVRNLAAQARRDGLRAEQLVLVLKRVWRELHEVRRSSEAVAGNRPFQQLISSCIVEYYADGHAEEPGSVRSG